MIISFVCYSRIQQILAPLTANVSIEIQQRAVEYSSLFERPQQFRYGILERMPIVKRGTAADSTFMNGEEGLTVPHADDTDDLLGYHGDKRDGTSKPRAPKHSDVSEGQSYIHSSIWNSITNFFGRAFSESWTI